MPKKQLPTIEDWLTNGPGSLRNLLYKWVREEQNHPGPWVIYIKVGEERGRLKEIWRENPVEMDPEDVPEWIDEVRDGIFEELGSAPTGRVRLVVEAYHDNQSKDRLRGIHIDNVVHQHAPQQMMFIQDEFFQGSMMQLHTALMQAHAHIIAQHEATTAMMAEGLHAQAHLATHRGLIESANGMQGITGIVNLLGMVAAVPIMNEVMKGGESPIMPFLMNAMQNGFGLKEALTQQAHAMTETNSLAMGLDELINRVDYRGWGDDRDPADIVIDAEFEEMGADPPLISTQPNPASNFDASSLAATLEEDPERLLLLLQNAGPKAKAYIKGNLSQLTPILMGR